VTASPLVVRAREGERRVLLGDIITTTVGAEQTDSQFSLIGNSGPRASRPIPMHYHEHEHEMFIPLRGSMQLWVAGESRILHPGDFGSVPAGVTHAYHFLGRHNQFLGYAMPGGFERMFRITGEPWDGYVYPAAGASGPPPRERFKEAEIEMQMKYVDDPYVEATEADDDALPGSCRPYYLKAGEGDRRLLLDQLFTVLMRSEESDGQAAIIHALGPLGAAFPPHRHDATTVGIWVLDGALNVMIDGEPHSLMPGDFAYLPAGCVWSYEMGSHYTQLHLIATPAGIEQLCTRASESYAHYMFPSNVVTGADSARLVELADGLDCQAL